MTHSSIVGLFKVVEFSGNASQPYPFVNGDAHQWSGENATYSDVRDFISALKIAAERAGAPRHSQTQQRSKHA